MLWIDDKYALLIGQQLRNFKSKSKYLYNASCPVCGDSAKNPSKARLYFYRNRNGISVKCHKCQYSATIGTFIKRIDANLYSEYVLERYKTGDTKYQPHVDITEAIPSIATQGIPFLLKLKCITTLPETHYAVKYVKKRKLPESVWGSLFYTPKFKKFVNTNVEYKYPSIVDDIPRLIIPFFDKTGKCFAFQGRAFGKELPKYYTIKLDKDVDTVYGMERVDLNRTILVSEGPLDSLFLPNAIAVSGSNFKCETIRNLKDKVVLVPDNEPRHTETTKILLNNIKEGYSVVIWPDNINEKDVNEMIQNGRTQDDIVNTIKANTFSGLEAIARFTSWAKV